MLRRVREPLIFVLIVGRVVKHGQHSTSSSRSRFVFRWLTIERLERRARGVQIGRLPLTAVAVSPYRDGTFSG